MLSTNAVEGEKETRVKFTPQHAVRDLKYDPQLHNSLEKHKDIDIVWELASKLVWAASLYNDKMEMN